MKITTEVFTTGEALYKCIEAFEPEYISNEKDIENAVNSLQEFFNDIVKDFEKALKNNEENTIEAAITKTLHACNFDKLTMQQKDILNLDINENYYI